jgi:phosphoribosyl-ATP pyrophosphohydrolase
MTASVWNWILAIVGTVASIAGVVFSCMAWVKAKGAKKAANEAVRSVKSKDTAHEFAKLAADAKELLAAVQDQRADRAIGAVNDLVHLLSVALSRRDEFLPR